MDLHGTAARLTAAGDELTDAGRRLGRLDPGAQAFAADSTGALGELGRAPAGHPIWPLLRRAGALPGDAVAGIAALRLEPVRGSAAELRQLAGEYTGRAVDVPADWTGTAATAYAARAADLSGYLRDSAG